MSQPLLELTIDFESHYTSKDNGGYSLSYMTTEEYVRDPRFEIIGFSIKKGAAPAQWFTGDLEYCRQVLRALPWHRIISIGHNKSEFDSLILTEVIGVRPLAYACTLQMARCLHGGKQAKSLAEMCKLYGLPDKGDEVVRAINKRRCDFSPGELHAYGLYCNNDSDRCYDLYRRFLPQMPGNEVWLASLSTKMFAEAKLALDRPLLLTMQQDMLVRKGQLMDRVADIMNIPKNLSPDERMLHTQKMLRKDQVLADILKNSYDVEPPMKYSPKKKDANGNPLLVYAFAKTDEGMTALLEFEDESDEQGAEDIQALAAARLSVKSTLAESRVNRFVDISGRGLLPVPLAYGKTHTHRLAGCLVADTKVICHDPVIGQCVKRIVDVALDDLVWDGGAFVEHDGVQFQGMAEVVEHDGVTGTECHPVFIKEGSDETIRLGDAKRTGTRLVACPEPTGGVADFAGGSEAQWRAHVPLSLRLR